MSLKLIPAKNIREGDYFMEGLFLGKPQGKMFLVTKVFPLLAGPQISFRGAKDDEMVTASLDIKIVVERF